MKRRTFITLLGGAAAAWPLGAGAQHTEQIRRIGVLMITAADDPESKARIAAFAQGLEETGWTDGRNVRIDIRWAAGDIRLFPAYAKELVALSPDILIANGTPSLTALREATRTTPIVFVLVIDPVGQGFVASLSRPGGNITGFSFVDFPMVGKWIELLKEIAPRVSRIALMFNPETTNYYYAVFRTMAPLAQSLGVKLTVAPVRDTAEIKRAFSEFGGEPSGGISVRRTHSRLSTARRSCGLRPSTGCPSSTDTGVSWRKAA
jgi:putative tryptophan/tyrosine transport system substrate-binding protein